MGKRAHSLVAVNSYVDILSSASYLCFRQESMSINAMSRFPEAVAESIKHATALSTLGH